MWPFTWLSNVRLGLGYERKVRQIANDLAGHLNHPRSDAELAWTIMDPAVRERENRAKDALWSLMTSTPGTAQIVASHSLDRAGLDELLGYWYVVGTVWRGVQFVPVSALTHPKTLEYALTQRGQVNGLDWAYTLMRMVEARDYWPPVGKEQISVDPDPSTSSTDPFWLFFPVGIGIAIGLNAGSAWWRWSLATAVAFTLFHVLFRSWHYRQYVAGMGPNSSNFAYFVMRLTLETLKIGIPALIALTVRQRFAL